MDIEEKVVLTVNNLSISLPERSDRKFAVSKASIKVRRGETLCLVGESGSGKSVMASAMMGDIAPQLKVVSGDIIFEDKNVLKMSSQELNGLRGSRISMIYQEPMAALNPSIKIGQQIEEVYQLHQPDFSKQQRKTETLNLLTQLKLPKPERIYDSYPHQISGGQCQRVVIAMALACKPDVLIADEPTTALDVTTQAEILRLINDLKEFYENATIFITHDFGVVAEIADRVAVMCWGEIVEEGSREEILLHPKQPYTQLLVDAMPLLEANRKPHFARQDAPVIEVKKLHKIYGSSKNQVHAVNDASFTLHSGETLGIVGESGSGKSTLAKTLIRLENANEGSVVINGKDFLSVEGKDLAKARKDIQMIFQDPFGSLNPSHSVGYAITRGLLIQGFSAKEARAKAFDLLENVGLPRIAFKRKPIKFSGGQRQRIGIARALAMGPSALIADESVSALDLSVQKQVLQLLDDLQKKYQMSIIFITHDLRVAAQISDYIAVMHNGLIVELGAATTIFETPRHAYTKQLIEAAPGRHWNPPRLTRERAREIANSIERL